MFLEYKNGEKYANKNADISDKHDSFSDCGWVLTEHDFVVDIDSLSKEIIKELIRIFDIRTQTVWTDRGVHFYFKKPKSFKRGANRISPLGFPYEIKHIKNTKSVTIKRNGVLRTIENEGIREEVPYIFYNNKSFEKLVGLDEGEGRNNKLYSLKHKIVSQKNWKKILAFANEYIFTKPLSDSEFSIIIRDEDVKAEKGNEYEVAEYLMRELDFQRYGQRYYFKDGECYDFQEVNLKKKVYQYALGQKSSYVDEVVKQMMYRCKMISQDKVFDIKFKNGYLRNGEFIELITDDFTPYTIDVEYDSEVDSVEVVDEYIHHLSKGDEDYKKLIFEVLGHSLIVDAEFKRMLAKFFIFIGDGGNGKGTLLQIIKMILGNGNVTGMSISELSDERYLASFKGKLANLGDDLQDQSINDKDMKILKNLSTCDYISTRELYKNAESMYFTGSLIFTSNHVLKSWEKGESYKRRVMWLPMYTRVKKKDPLFITKLTTDESLKYWIKLIVDGYKRLYKNGCFTQCKIVDDFNAQYHRENNPSLDYIEDMVLEDFDGVPVSDVYKSYKEWCEDNAVKFSEKMIRETLQEVFGLKRKQRKVNGKNAKCFLLD